MARPAGLTRVILTLARTGRRFASSNSAIPAELSNLLTLTADSNTANNVINK